MLSLTDISHACVLYDDCNDRIVLFYDSEAESCNRDYIIKGLNDLIPKYMYPKVIHKMNRLPYNINGKVDRKKLKECINRGIYEGKN